MPRITRRSMLIAAGLTGGGLLVGAVGAGVYVQTFDRRALQRPETERHGARMVTQWITVAPDGAVRILCPHTEMGQGTQTGILQIVLDELSADPDKTTIELAPASPAFSIGETLAAIMDEVFHTPDWARSVVEKAMGRMAQLGGIQFTGGSMATRFTGMVGMRKAAAAAREMLTAAAADKMEVDVSELTTDAGEVVHASSGRRLGYGELAEAAAAMPMPSDPAFKDRSTWTAIGTAFPRIDLPDKIFAKAIYGMDVDVPGMRFAAVAPPTVAHGRVLGVSNQAEIEAMPGVEAVVLLDHVVAVVADNPWRAEQAVRKARITAAPPEGGAIDTTANLLRLRSTLEEEGGTVGTRGEGAAPPAPDDITADYTAPFLAHVPMEPLNATVWVEGDAVHVATGVQGPLACRATAAESLGIPTDKVILHAHTMGGGFGRRNGLNAASLNWVHQACQIHNAVGGAVKLIWSREAEIALSPCRPADAARMRATLGADGKPTHWSARTYAPVMNAQEAMPVYAIPHVSVASAGGEPALPFAYWRSVDASSYVFFIESFIDELARAARQDPVTYRLSMLDGRLARVLTRVAEMADWHNHPGGDTALGVAVAECFGSVIAEVAEVSMRQGKPRVHRVWCAVDCGTAVNPGSVVAQVEGGIHYGLSAALYGKVETREGAIVQSNFHNYPVVTFQDAPSIQVEILSSPDAPVGGVGEVSTPCIAPAVANALAALGTRHRDLPLT